MQTNKKTVIFDFDGTIADSVETTIHVLNHIAHELGYPECKLSAQMLQTHKIPDLLKQFKIPILKLPFLVGRIKKELHKHIDKIPPVPHIKPILADLAQQGYCMHILTSNSEKNVQIFLEKNKMQYFDCIYSATNIFGKSRVINNLLKSLNMPKNQAIYIGDEVRDIEAAQKSCVTMIAVTWGFNSAELLAKHKPDFLVTTPGKLLEAIETIDNS